MNAGFWIFFMISEAKFCVSIFLKSFHINGILALTLGNFIIGLTLPDSWIY